LFVNHSHLSTVVHATGRTAGLIHCFTDTSLSERDGLAIAVLAATQVNT